MLHSALSAGVALPCPGKVMLSTNSQQFILLKNTQESNNENTETQGGEHHMLGPVSGWEARGGRALGQIANACRA